VNSINYNISGASVIGRDHLNILKNCQDSYTYQAFKDGFVGVVCDGCGTGQHSEVGSKIASSLITKILINTIKNCGDEAPDVLSRKNFWSVCEAGVLHNILTIAYSMGEDVANILSEYFLFTIVGVIQTNDKIAFFSLGDGFISINGENKPIGPFVDNYPPYIIYKSLEYKQRRFAPRDIEFSVDVYDTNDVENFLIGSDGVCDLIQEDGKLVEDFWSNPDYYTNTEVLKRRLKILGGGILRFNGTSSIYWKDRGILKDDTTMIIGSKILPAKEEITTEDIERGETIG
jgi:hypothetical protein